MARKSTRSAASQPAAKKPSKAAPVAKKAPPPPPPVKAKKPVPAAAIAATPPAAPPRASVNGAAKSDGAVEKAARPAAPRSAAEARTELMGRSTENENGARVLRSDPLADAQAARRVVEFAQSHGSELQRRGLYANYAEAALGLAREIEDHLQSLPAAAAGVRARSAEAAELVSDAAALVQPARDAVLRVTRGPDGRRAAHAFGIGDAYSPRQPRHVLRALRKVVAAAEQFPAAAADAGLVAEDLRAMKELGDELEELAGSAKESDEAAALHTAHGALRAYFDLVAAKATLAFAGDPDERMRLHRLIPRADERRHLRLSANQAPAA